jgi:hypothetical protein
MYNRFHDAAQQKILHCTISLASHPCRTLSGCPTSRIIRAIYEEFDLLLLLMPSRAHGMFSRSLANLLGLLGKGLHLGRHEIGL